MASLRLAPTVPPRLGLALAATAIAFLAALLASLNLYLLEDGNALTASAYSASPLLRVSYDAVYLSALIAGVAVCAIAGYTLVRADALVTVGAVMLALLVALAGFGGLLLRSPATFLVLFLGFVGLSLLCLLVGRAVAVASRRRLPPRAATILGACVGTGVALLVNGLALVTHTLALNPVSHPLFMQGQIEGTHLSSLLIGMGLNLLTLFLCVLSIGAALRTPAPAHRGLTD
jgi:hypothetical protein